MKDGNPEEFVVDSGRAFEAIKNGDEIGFCATCGHEQPADTRAIGDECEQCGNETIFGAWCVVLMSLRVTSGQKSEPS